MFADFIANAKKEYKDHPEKYPEEPGMTWRIVLCEMDGTLIENTGETIKRPISYKIMHLADGLERNFITFLLK